jgi:hypothetical protein
MLLTALHLAFAALQRSGLSVSYAIDHLAALSDGTIGMDEARRRERVIVDEFDSLPEDALALLQALLWHRRPARTGELVSALSHAADTHGGIHSSLAQPELRRQQAQIGALRASSVDQSREALRLARSALERFVASQRG